MFINKTLNQHWLSSTNGHAKLGNKEPLSELLSNLEGFVLIRDLVKLDVGTVYPIILKNIIPIAVIIPTSLLASCSDDETGT